MDYIYAIILGLFSGIIVNILADDLPLRRAPRLPRYIPLRKKQAVRKPVYNDDGENITLQYAREDDEPRPISAWLGIAAFLLNQRTSSDGTATMSWRYPLAEIMTAFFMALAVFAINLLKQEGIIIDSLQTAFWLFYMAVFSLVIVIDVEHKLILFAVIIPSAVIALLDAGFATYKPSLVEAIYGGFGGFIIFFLIYNGGFLFNYLAMIIRGDPIEKVAFGYGDVMMATLSGLILGWQALVFAMFFAIFLGAFAAIVVIAVQIARGKYSAFMAIPYGPFIVIGTLVMLLFGDTVIPNVFGWAF
jgi:leader peptidase (prepilin peptidase)/N-methyltransferase